MKKLVTLVMVLALASVGCEAFKSSYDNMPQSEVTTPAIPGVSGEGTGAKFVCDAVKDITVAKSSEAGVVTETVLASAAEGAVVAASAEKLAENVTQITITSDDEEILSFVIAKGDDDAFSVCSIDSKEGTIASGTITVDAFNDGADKDIAKAINSGTFKIELFEATSAASVMQAAASEDPSVSNMIEGSYFVTGLAVAK